MATMGKIYSDSEEKFVKNFVLYGKLADGKLYYESSYTNLVTKNDAVKAFENGCIIDFNESSCRPVYMSISSGSSPKATLYVMTSSGSSSLGIVPLQSGT